MITLQNNCYAFIGITKVLAEPTEIQYLRQLTPSCHQNCCNAIPKKVQVPELKSLPLKNLNIEVPDISNHKLDILME